MEFSENKNMLSGLKPSANQVTSGNISSQNFSSKTLSVIHEQESNQLSTLANLPRSKFMPNQQAMLHNQEIRLKVYKEIRKSGKSEFLKLYHTFVLVVLFIDVSFIHSFE